MTNVANVPTAPGLALVGDAALAIDPLWGVGCGWALQSAEWLTDCVSGALVGSEPLPSALKRNRRRHARALRGHALMIYDYAGGRKFSPVERLLFSTATYDRRLAAVMEAFGSRNIGPLEMMRRGLPLALRARVARAIAGRRGGRSGTAAAASASGGSGSRVLR
jgi:flavin-dependent dehydrogenase